MIDISDGLKSDLDHISKASGLGYKILESRIPIHQQTKNASLDFNIDHVSAALYGGEDYELLFTIDPKEKGLVENIEGLSIIGELVKDEKKKLIIKDNGDQVTINHQGWDHFNTN